MILILHKKKLIMSAIIIISLTTLFYLDGSKIAGTFFRTAKIDGIRTVILDPGHGGEDPGAVSDISMIKEKDVNIKIALMIKELLEKENIKVILTRNEDILKYEPGTRSILKKRKQDLEIRKKLIDESGADIAVSIHLNKFPQPQYFGAQVFYPPNFLESKKLGDSIQTKIREKVAPDNKREALEKKEPIIILKNPKIVTVVVECGFLSNPEEESKLITNEYQKKLAEGIKEGIKSYFYKN